MVSSVAARPSEQLNKMEQAFRPVLIYESATTQGDQGFIDQVLKGARKAREEVGIAYADFRMRPEDDRVARFKAILDEGFTHVIAVGFQNMVPILTLADQYPQVKFTLIDGIIPPIYKNVQSVSFKDHEGAFLVGIIAAHVAKRNKIGFIGGMDVPLINNFALGFYQGAKYINPDIKMLRDNVGEDHDAWNNPERAATLARKQFNEGVDVIFAAAGGSSIGVLKAADQMGRYAIGVDTNQNAFFPGTVITSMVKRVDLAVYQTLTSAYSGRWEPGIEYLGLREGALDYAVDIHNKDEISLDVIEAVEKARDKIMQGALEVEMYKPY